MVSSNFFVSDIAIFFRFIPRPFYKKQLSTKYQFVVGMSSIRLILSATLVFFIQFWLFVLFEILL